MHSETPPGDPGQGGGGNRWIRFLRHLHLALLGGVALLLAALAGGWILGGGVIARQTAALLNARVFDEDTRLVVERVSGFPLLGLTIEGASLERRGPQGWFPFGRADRLDVAYDLWGLLHGRYKVTRVTAMGLGMEFRRGEDGSILIPTTRGGGGGGDKPQLSIENVRVADGSILFEVPWRELQVEDVSGGLDVTIVDNVLRFASTGLRGTLADSLGPLLVPGGSLLVNDGPSLDSLVVHWDGTDLILHGRPGSQDMDLAGRIEDLPLERLGRLLQEPNLEPGHVEWIDLTFRRETDRLGFAWSGEGTWDVWEPRATSGRGFIADRTLRLLDVDLMLRGAHVTYGSLSLAFDEKEFTVDGNFEGVDPVVFQLPPFEQTPGILNGTGTVLFTDRARPFESLEAQINLDHSRLREVPFLSGRVELGLRDAVWHLDSLRVELERASLRGTGKVTEDSLSLDFLYAGDLRAWRGFVRQDDLTGTGFLTVGLRGQTTHPRLQASGVLQQLNIGAVRATRVELREADGFAANPRDLTLDFLAPSGIRVGNLGFSHGDGRIRLTDDHVFMEGLRLDQGDTTVTVEGSVTWDPHLRVFVDRADASLADRVFAVRFPGRIDIRGDVVSSPGFAVETPKGKIFGAGRWNRRTHLMDAFLQVESLDPQVFYALGDTPYVQVESIDGSVDLAGTFPFLEGDVDLRMGNLRWETGRLDSLRTRLHIADTMVRVDTVSAVRGAGRIDASGRVRFPVHPYEMLESVAVGPTLEPDSTTWDLQGTVSRLQLFDWLGYLERRDRPAGTINAEVALGGSWGSPEVHLTGDGRAVTWRGIRSDSLFVDATLADDVVRIRELRGWHTGSNADLIGSMPLDVQIYPFRWEFPNEEMALRFTSEGASIENLRFTRWIEEAQGALDADVVIYGHPTRPLLRGTASVAGATVRPQDRHELLTGVTGTARFDGALVTLEDVRAKLGDGSVRATGTYRLYATETETYAMKVTFDKAVVKDPGIYAARVSGELSLTPIRAADGFIYPFASGDLLVHRAEYAGSLQPQDIGRFRRRPILYEVTLDAPNKIIIFTEEVSAELGGEDLIVRQGINSREILGDLTIIRGSYQFFLNRFDITEGTLTWNRPDTVLPDLDVFAQTIDAGYLIEVHLTGRADEPVLNFSATLLETGEDAGLSSEAIVARLAAGSVGLSAALDSGEPGTGSAGDNTAEAVARGLVSTSGLFLAPLERRLVRELGVDDIEIQTGLSEGGSFEATIGLTKYVTPELRVIYRQALNHLLTQDIAVEYRLRRTLILRGEARRFSDDTIGLTNEFNLDLRVRHDY